MKKIKTQNLWAMATPKQQQKQIDFDLTSVGDILNFLIKQKMLLSVEQTLTGRKWSSGYKKSN